MGRLTRWATRWRSATTRHDSEELSRAKSALRNSRSRRPEVERIAKDLRERRMENHFAERMRWAFEIGSTENGDAR